MKKLILYFALFLLSIINSNACDVCGCSSGASYMGILPQFSKNVIGLRYRYRVFEHNNTAASATTTGMALEDRFHTVDLWSRLYLGKRWMLFGFLPYSYYERKETDATEKIQSIGDISAQLNYMILNTGDSTEKKVRQTWMIGAGVKLPTGKYQQRDRNKNMFPLPFQIGSGAYTLRLNTIYTIRVKGFGWNNDIAYNYNLENELEYKLGNQFTWASTIFYWKKWMNISVLPNAGIFFEQMSKDQQYGYNKTTTGGKALFFTLGTDVYYKNIILGGTVQVVGPQNTGIDQPMSKWRLMMQCSYLF